MRQPSFIHGGAQKCATTWWYNCMKEHPDIHLGPKNTIRFFECPYYQEHDWDWYLRHFEGARHDQVIGEARAEYLYNPESPGLIHRHLPECKLVFHLRDPVERAVSACIHNIRRGNFPNQPVEDCLGQAFQAHRSGRATDREDLLKRVIEMGFYAQQLDRFLQRFAMERVLILLYDDIVRDPLNCIRASCRFLGVKEIRPKGLRRQPLKSSGSGFLTGLERATRGIPGSIRVLDWSNRALAHVGAGKRSPAIDPGLRASLEELYAPHNQRLLALLRVYRRCEGAVTGQFANDWPAWVLGQ